jgi:hypothetical protein
MISKINKVPVVLHTMDSYSPYWDNWFFLFTKHCKNHGTIFFLSEEKEPSFVSKVTHIKTGNGEWGARLLKGFESIDSQLIIYMQEDFWPKKDLTLTDDLLKIFHEKEMQCLKINNVVQPIQVDVIDGELCKVRQNSPYSLTHQFGIWNKEFFKKHIYPNENPWVNEISGSNRINKEPHNIYQINHEWYDKVCSRGTLNTNGIKMLETYNLEFNGKV